MKLALGALSVNVPGALTVGLGIAGFGFLGGLAGFVAGIAPGALWFRFDRTVVTLLISFVASLIVPILAGGFAVPALRVIIGDFEIVTLEEAAESEGRLVGIEKVSVEHELIGATIEKASAGQPGQWDKHYFVAPVFRSRSKPAQSAAVS